MMEKLYFMMIKEELQIRLIILMILKLNNFQVRHEILLVMEYDLGTSIKS